MPRLRPAAAGLWLALAQATSAALPAPPAPPPAAPSVAPEPTTVERHLLIAAYDLLQPEADRALRVEFPGVDGQSRVAHWQLPSGPGPHPTVLVFPIRAGNHVVSEALAKALVNRGYAAVWMERRVSLFGEDDERPPGDFGAFAADLGNFVLDARSLIGWLATRPEVDAAHIATAGVSLGGILAATTLAADQPAGVTKHRSHLPMPNTVRPSVVTYDAKSPMLVADWAPMFSLYKGMRSPM